jgi:uncharacterized repeat protein (TIGR01451 family)
MRLKRTARVALVVLAIFSSAGLFNTGAAFAADNGSVSLRPANEDDFFHISLAPGAAIDATAIASNKTAAAITLHSYPVDGKGTTQGTFVLASQTDPRVGVGAWVKMDAAPLVVAANSESPIPFRLSVPLGTPPGEYAGGLIVQTPPQAGKAAVMSNGDSIQMSSIQRVGVRIYLTVAGTAITTLKHGVLAWQRTGDTITFSLPVRNTGNTILHPVANVRLTSRIGPNARLTFETPESLLPGAIIIMHARLKPLPQFESGTATATLNSEAGTATSQTTLAFAPWGLIALSLLGLALVTYGLFRVIRFLRNNRHLINWA